MAGRVARTRVAHFPASTGGYMVNTESASVTMSVNTHPIPTPVRTVRPGHTAGEGGGGHGGRLYSLTSRSL